MRHQKQHPRSRGDTRKRACKQAHQSADINQYSQQRNAAYHGQHTHRGLARPQIVAGGALAQKFRVSTDGEYASREKCTLDDSARNCLQRVARFGTECGGALKSDKTEKCEDETEPQTAAGHATELQLL